MTQQYYDSKLKVSLCILFNFMHSMAHCCAYLCNIVLLIKCILSCAFLFSPCWLFSFDCQAQLKSYIISVKGDTLNRVDNNGKQGPWVVHVDDLRGEQAMRRKDILKMARKKGTGEGIHCPEI